MILCKVLLILLLVIIIFIKTVYIFNVWELQDKSLEYFARKGYTIKSLTEGDYGKVQFTVWIIILILAILAIC